MADEHDRELESHRQGEALRAQIVARFKAAYHRRESPAIDDFLADSTDQRSSLLIELIQADMEFRFQVGQAVRVEQYLQRYPELAANADTVIELIRAEYTLRRRAEPAIEIDEFYRRFPQYRTQLVNRLGQPVSPGEN